MDFKDDGEIIVRGLRSTNMEATEFAFKENDRFVIDFMDSQAVLPSPSACYKNRKITYACPGQNQDNRRSSEYNSENEKDMVEWIRSPEGTTINENLSEMARAFLDEMKKQKLIRKYDKQIKKKGNN
ncbi:hypothetical protein J6590_097793 [Homalodisca vitripennis]|nr:hypothetical protein J6590_097793 [Homalodisca vitripennis]